MSFMDKIVERAGLTDIAEKVFAAQRLTVEDGLRLYATRDLNRARLPSPNHVRERKNGNVATYVLNLYLNYSNICILSCQFCAFARRPHEKEGQFTYDIDEMARRAKEEYDKGATRCTSSAACTRSCRSSTTSRWSPLCARPAPTSP